jgi:hypothetical protein
VQEAQPYTGKEPSFNIPSGSSVHEEMNKALFRRRASFCRIAYRFLENTADAEDAVQDALLSAYQHIDQFRGEAQMSTWLTAIVPIVPACNCASGRARFTRHWTNPSTKSRNTPYQNYWPTAARVPRTNAEIPNCVRAWKNWRPSSAFIAHGISVARLGWSDH